MKTSPDGRAFIEAFEGKFLHTYDDGTGVLTIGYGHTSAAGPPKVARGDVITETQCDAILANDLDAVERNVTRIIKVPMTQSQFDALVSFDFNTGSLGKSSIDDKINADNPVAAMATLLQYDHAGGRQMAGLTRRRRAEQMLFTGQVARGMALAGAHQANPGGPMPQAPTRPPVVILPPGPTPPDAPRPDLVPQVTKPPATTAAKVGNGAAIVIGAGGTAATVAYHGYSLIQIGLSAFIAAGLVTAVVLLVRKMRD